jgi:NADH-quinone oxidoreductase subunit K
MSLELMFLSVNFNFIILGNYLGDLTGQVFVFFVLTVVAAESGNWSGSIDSTIQK